MASPISSKEIVVAIAIEQGSKEKNKTDMNRTLVLQERADGSSLAASSFVQTSFSQGKNNIPFLQKARNKQKR